MGEILALYGSPRRDGNTTLLLKAAVRGAVASGATVDEYVLRDLKMSPCVETYTCKGDGRCVIQDDFQVLYDRLLTCRGLMVASPIFFYSVSAQTKILIDRCQSLWVKKYMIEKAGFGVRGVGRKALFIAAGATRGKKLFEGTLLTMKYFLDVLDMNLWRSLLYRGVDGEGDVLRHPEYLEEAYLAGKEFTLEIGARSEE